MAVTSETVRTMAEKYLDPEAMQIVVVGDASQIQSIMEQYGPVEVYDTEGSLLEN